MHSELFRFAIVRPPLHVNNSSLTATLIPLRTERSGFIEDLKRAKKADDRAAMLSLSRNYLASPAFVRSIQSVDPKWQSLLLILEQSGDAGFEDLFKNSLLSIYSDTATGIVNSPDFTETQQRIAESIVAAAIVSGVSSQNRKLLMDLAFLQQLIVELSKQRTIQNFIGRPSRIQLPGNIFPLPLQNKDLKKHRKEQAEKAKAAKEKMIRQNLDMVDELNESKGAINELMVAFEKMPAAGEVEPTGAIMRERPLLQKGFILPKKQVDKISGGTQAAIKRLDVFSEDLDIARTITALDRNASTIARKLYGNSGSRGRTIKIGNSFLSADVLDFDDLLVSAEPVSRTPGTCAPAIINDTTDEGHVSVTTSGNHEVRVLGIADLMIVEQELKRYQLGEIAHIENVMKSEIRDRKHRNSKIIEESVLNETEETEINEKDLSSSDRFELQTEAQRVINETTGIAAGVTVNASYGPIDTTANFNYANNNAVTESQRTASNFARDTTSRAVNKIEKRKLERRFRRTVEEVEEINQHTFNNKDGDSISGLYRFVDKIYNAQIVNYGKRLMLEFIVPEPAAFIRYALTNQPPPHLVSVKPEEPGFCIGGRRFQPLQVLDIDRYNYLYWASKYGVKDIDSPPPYTLVVSTAMTSSLKEMDTAGDSEDREYFNTKSISIDIPDGYTPVNADIVINAMLDYVDDSGDVAMINVLIDNKTFTNNGLNQLTFSKGTWKNVAIAANTFNKALYAVVVNAFCRLSVEKEQQWQLKTFTAIMNAFEDKKSRYDTEMEAARMRASYNQVQGSNPFMNRETEKTELKKSCISMLTGQRFDSFDAMNSNVAPFEYPEIDFEEAGDEGKFVSFFEQAMEWNNITYIFYPYFWGRKSDWLTTSQLNDDDPLFTRFLQAGSCRVHVPVRLGFETNMLTYLDTNIIWAGEGELINGDESGPNPMHLSLIDELKGQLQNNNVQGVGALNVSANNKLISGIGTEFSTEDVNKRINIGGHTYIIKKVNNPLQVELNELYKGETSDNIGYSMGARLVGEPWEVKLPTNLVKLDSMQIN